MGDELLRTDSISTQKQENLEAALLRTVLKARPRALKESELVREMSSIAASDGRPADVHKALERLIGAGLLSHRGSAFEPTLALLRFNDLMLKL
jgi:hypothetical protein